MKSSEDLRYRSTRWSQKCHMLAYRLTHLVMQESFIKGDMMTNNNGIYLLSCRHEQVELEQLINGLIFVAHFYLHWIMERRPLQLGDLHVTSIIT